MASVSRVLACAVLVLVAIAKDTATDDAAFLASVDTSVHPRRLRLWCGDAPKMGNTRPSDREQTTCVAWWQFCPCGYTWREVTMGPECNKWYHSWGKCVDDRALDS